jgi:hypothetical protein
MTEELNNSIDDESMVEFFASFVDIAPNHQMDEFPQDAYWLLPKEDIATLYIFDITDNLIDNIRQVGDEPTV